MKDCCLPAAVAPHDGGECGFLETEAQFSDAFQLDDIHTLQLLLAGLDRRILGGCELRRHVCPRALRWLRRSLEVVSR